jgi:hypothetical protein
MQKNFYKKILWNFFSIFAPALSGIEEPILRARLMATAPIRRCGWSDVSVRNHFFFHSFQKFSSLPARELRLLTGISPQNRQFESRTLSVRNDRSTQAIFRNPKPPTNDPDKLLMKIVTKVFVEMSCL